MKIIFTNSAGPFRVFAPGAFDRCIGQQVVLSFEGDEVETCTVESVIISSNGKYVHMTLDVPDGAFTKSLSIELVEDLARASE